MGQFLKVMIGAVLVLVLCVGAWLAFVLLRPPTVIEKVLPSNAAFYLRFSHAEEYVSRIQASGFWRSIASIDIPKVLARNHVSADKIKQIEEWKANTALFLKDPLVQKFFGKEIAIAAYRQGEAYGALMVLRLSPSIQAAEFLSHLSSQWGEKISTSQETYKGMRIVHVRLKDKQSSFKYVRVKDLLILALDDDPGLLAVIDVIQRQQPSLLDDSNFTSAKGHSYPVADGFFFINTSSFREDLADDDWMQGALGETIGFKTYSLSFVPGDIFRYKFVVGVDGKAVKPALRRLLSCGARPNKTLSFVPPHVIGYHWGGCYDFDGSWQQAREQLHSLPEFEDGLRRLKRGIEKRSSVKLTDILPLLGDEAGGYITDIDTLSLVPYPRFLSFVKVKDRNRIEEILKGISKTPIGPIQEEEYVNTKIRFINLPLGSNMDPAYCFVGDYLLASSSRQLLKKSIDIYANPDSSLGRQKVFEGLGLNLPQGSQGMIYFKVGEISRRAQALVGWANKYFSSQMAVLIAAQEEAESESKKLAQDISSKEAELILITGKIKQWKAKLLGGLPLEEQQTVMDTIDYFESSKKELEGDLRASKAATDDLQDQLLRSREHIEAFKLTIYNSEHVLMPILKGLGTFNMHGMRMNIATDAIETEWIFH